MNTKILAAIAIVVVLGVGALALGNNDSTQSADNHDTSATTTKPTQLVDTAAKSTSKTIKPSSSAVSAADTTEGISIEKYVTKHISEFAPVKEQLGGKFQVTKVSAYGGVGSVTYDDGHTTYTADFKYSIDEFGSISIDSFVVRK